MRQTDSLAAALRQHRQDYYRDGSSAVNDEEFDRLEEQLRALDPENPYFQLVGARVPSEGKIEHQIAMLSLDKARNLGELERWQKRLLLTGLVQPDTTILVQPKIDGLSASCRYQNGQLSYVATRGDGRVGQDISHVAPYLRDVPEKIAIDDEIEVRGELYLPKDSSFIDENVRSLRNSCVGLINRKEQRDDLRHVRFAAYQCVRHRLSRSEGEQIDALENLGFHTVECHYAKDLGEIELLFQRYLEEWRRRWPYETDGLVLCLDDSELFDALDRRWTVDHHHHYAVALKPPSAQGTTTLQRVDWQVSRQGALVPVAVFDPIKLSGAQISRASVHNYQNAVHLHLRTGDTLLVARSNDVIPYVLANLSPPGDNGVEEGESSAPRHCPSCSNPLQRQSVHLVCPNPQCPEQAIQRCVYWVKQAEMSQVSEKTIRKLFLEGKVCGVGDLYRLKREDLQPLKGFAELSIDNLLQQIEQSRTSTIIEFLTRLGVPSLQRKAWRELGALLVLRKLTLGLCDRLVTRLSPDGNEVPTPTASSAPILPAVDALKLVWEQSERGVQLPALLSQTPLLAILLPCYQLLTEDQWRQCWRELLDSASLQLPFALIDDWLDTPEAPMTVKQWRQHCAASLRKNKLRLVKAEVAEQLTLDDFLNPDPALCYDAVIAANWAEWLSSKPNQLLVNELREQLNVLPPSRKLAVTRPIVALSGEGPAPRQLLVQRLEKLGFDYSATISKSVNILLCGNPDSTSGKLKQARKYGIQIVSYDDFFSFDEHQLNLLRRM